jgi:transcriptional regulator NrdR family protein
VRCPQCRSTNTRIADSRSDERGLTARRRQCNRCSHRFSTVVREEVEEEIPGQHTTYSQLNSQRPAKHQV